MPTTNEALATLSRIWEERKLGYEAKVSVKNDWAGLEIVPPCSGDSIVIYSPGDRWVSLQIPGGFSTIYFEEGMTSEDRLMWFERYVDAAIAYLNGHYVLHRSPRLRIPHVDINTSLRTVRLDLGPKATMCAVMTRGRARS